MFGTTTYYIPNGEENEDFEPAETYNEQPRIKYLDDDEEYEKKIIQTDPLNLGHQTAQQQSRNHSESTKFINSPITPVTTTPASSQVMESEPATPTPENIQAGASARLQTLK